MLAASVVAPVWLAATHLGNASEAAYDPGLARVVGWDAQVWRALDVVAGSLFALVPIGSLAVRAAMGGVLILGALGGVLFLLIRDLLGRCADAPRMGPVVAAVAAVSAVVAPGLQREATAPGGGAVTGALLVFAPLAFLASGKERARAAVVSAALALAVAYEPLVGGCALAAASAFVGTNAQGRALVATAWRDDRRAILGGALGGLAPLLIALGRVRVAGVPVLAAMASGWAGERGASGGGSPVRYAELGTALLVLALGGSVLAALVERARPLAAAFAAVAITGLACGWAGAALGPTRFGAPLLAATSAICALAGVAMQAIARWVAETKLPFARGSAAMIVLFELVVPVDEADEALLRTRSPTRAQAASLWNDLAWGVLPPRSVVVVTDDRLLSRAAAAAALGELRGDVTIVPVRGTAGAMSRRALASDAALVPLWRDLELTGAPSEASLSSLATARPVAMPYEPRWAHAIGRHLVPLALLDRFSPEPRGPSDRRRALDAFGPQRDRLSALVGRADADDALAASTAYLLRARAMQVASSGDRDLIGRAIDDLHLFAPEDPVAAQIVARMTLGRGAPKLDDLRP
jgi:hypothetical protein